MTWKVIASYVKNDKLMIFHINIWIYRHHLYPIKRSDSYHIPSVSRKSNSIIKYEKLIKNNHVDGQYTSNHFDYVALPDW